MIDTHCHLDRVQDLSEALAHDLRAVLTVATSSASWARVRPICEQEVRVFAVVGLHPNEADRLEQEKDPLAEALRHPGVVGVGETGIDLYWDAVPLAAQQRSFVWHAEMAAEHDLPLVLHVRDADGPEAAASLATATLLRELQPPRGVLHCTNGHRPLLETALALGWYVSFAGNLTYPKAAAVREAAVWVPEERLLVETDAPFLAPVPHRGRKNLPAYVRFTASELARLRGVDPQVLEDRLDANAIQAFDLPLADPASPPPAVG